MKRQTWPHDMYKGPGAPSPFFCFLGGKGMASALSLCERSIASVMLPAVDHPVIIFQPEMQLQLYLDQKLNIHGQMKSAESWF